MSEIMKLPVKHQMNVGTNLTIPFSLADEVSPLSSSDLKLKRTAVDALPVSETGSGTNRDSTAGLLMKLAQGQGGQVCGSRKMLYRTAPLLGPVWMSEVLQNSSAKLS